MHLATLRLPAFTVSFPFPEALFDVGPLRLFVAFRPAPTIADRIERSGHGLDANGRDFDILNAALDAAGLKDALDDRKSDLTLLAPTDDAFIKLAQSFGFEGSDEAGALDAILATLSGLSPDGNPIPLLTQVLLYHVLPESLTAREIAGRDSLATLAGVGIKPFGRTLGDLDPTAEDPEIIAFRADQRAANGFVQAIDRVLLPADLAELFPSQPELPSIAAIVERSGGFDSNRLDYDILNAALDITGLKAALADPEADLTLLAPNDGAFLQLARAFGFRGASEEGALEAIAAGLAGIAPDGDAIGLLTDILLYHVLPEKLSREQLQARGEVDTLLGDPLAFAGREIIDAEPDAIARFTVAGSNLEASNGAVQGISGVLLPADLAFV